MQRHPIIHINHLDLRTNGQARAQQVTYEVPFVLPGEKVEVETVHKKGLHRTGLPARVLTSHPFRKKPDCQHYGSCAACHLRHVRYTKSTQIKRDIFSQELKKYISSEEHARIEGGLKIIPATDPLHYRNTVRFYLHDRHLQQRTMLKHDMFTVRECHVASMASWKLVNTWKSKLPSSCSMIEVRENKKGEQMCIISTQETQKLPTIPVHSYYAYNPETNVYTHKYGATTLTHDLEVAGQHFSFDMGPSSFFQVHTAMAERLYQYVTKFIPRTGTLMDLYAGTGTIGIVMAKLFPDIDVISAEIQEDMVSLARANAQRNSVHNISFLQADVRTERFDQTPECIIVDPPRNGLSQESIMHLTSLGAQRIIYISCNPQSLLRDMKAILSTHRIAHIRLFDMMPYTSHMELVCVFERIG